MNKWGLIFSLVCFFGVSAIAQDAVRIMYYNLLNFPSDSPERVIHLRKILGYTKPDIFVVNELLSASGATSIINDALNVWGTDKYNAVTYMDGPDTDNMLYYNTEKLGFISQIQIPTSLRDISEYTLYYKSPGINEFSDTVYLHIYSVHLKAGTAHFDQRKEEVIVLKYRLNTLLNNENIFVGGDFNFYSGHESGCLAIRETGNIDLYDPINSIGNWNNNGTYAEIHTQSTRSYALSDGAGGGLDDRFDLIFVSEDILDNENGVEYIENSYQALGQDGDRFNASINAPYNPVIPDSIANALYYMSDHLPVLMDIQMDYTAEIIPEKQLDLSWYLNPINKELIFNKKIENAEFILFDLSGKIIFQTHLQNENIIYLPHTIQKGMLIWTLYDNEYPKSTMSNKLILY